MLLFYATPYAFPGKATNPLKQLPFRGRGRGLCMRIPNERLSLWNVWKTQGAKKWNTTIIWHVAPMNKIVTRLKLLGIFIHVCAAKWLKPKANEGNNTQFIMVERERKTDKHNSWLVSHQCLSTFPLWQLFGKGPSSLGHLPSHFNPVKEPHPETPLRLRTRNPLGSLLLALHMYTK